MHIYLFTLVTGALLFCCAASSSATHEHAVMIETPGYELSDEETIAYWRLHYSHTEQQPDAQGVSNDPSPSTLKKRSPEGIATCVGKDRTVTNRDGVIVERYKHSFRSATCMNPFSTPIFWATCDYLYIIENDRWEGTATYIGRCPLDHVCVPNWLMQVGSSSAFGHFGTEHQRHDDIACIYEAVPARKPMMIRPSKFHSTMCTPETKVPWYSDKNPHNPKPIPASGMTVLMTESLEVSGGGAFNASKIYIRDSTSPFLKVWDRGLNTDSDTASDQTILYPGETRTIRFCVEFAKGFTQWLVLHYGAFEVSKARRGRIHSLAIEGSEYTRK